MTCSRWGVSGLSRLSLRPVHLHGPGAGAAGRGTAPAGGALGRQQHLVRPPLLGAAVPCHGAGPHAPLPPGYGGVRAAAKTFEKLSPICYNRLTTCGVSA